MAKKQGFSLQDLEAKGYVQSADGSYSKSTGDYQKAIKVIKKSLGTKPLLGEFVGDIVPKQKVNNSPDFEFKLPVESFLIINGIVAGLNGSHGLMQSHWSNNKKQKDLYRQIIRDQLKEGKIRRHSGKIKIQYIGYKSRFMDWDNFAASFKFVGDSLVKEKIISDDSPKFVIEFLPKQIKCKQSEQKVIVIIQDY